MRILESPWPLSGRLYKVTKLQSYTLIYFEEFPQTAQLLSVMVMKLRGE